MSVSTEWCTKKQAAKLVSRTERTISRIVREALEKRSADVLANLKLVYADGTEVPGPDVTLELIAKNEQEGTRTRWFFKRAWWRDEFAARLNESSSEDQSEEVAETAASGDADSGGATDETLREAPPLPTDPTIRAVVLEHLHYSDRKHAVELRQLTERVLQVVETNQQLQAQTNTLYNQFQDALKQSGGLRLLVDGRSAPAAQRPTTEQHTETEVIEIPPQPEEGRQPTKRSTKRARPKAPQKRGARPAHRSDPFPTFRKLARFFTN